TPTFAVLTQGPGSGNVNVNMYLNRGDADAATNSKGFHQFGTATGQDLILLGSLTNFTVIDRVPAARKPGDTAGDKGIKVERSNNSNTTLELEAGDNDTLIQIVGGDHIQVNDRSTNGPADHGVEGFSYFGTGVSQVVINTNNLPASGFRVGGNADDLT